MTHPYPEPGPDDRHWSLRGKDRTATTGPTTPGMTTAIPGGQG